MRALIIEKRVQNLNRLTTCSSDISTRGPFYIQKVRIFIRTIVFLCSLRIARS